MTTRRRARRASTVPPSPNGGLSRRRFLTGTGVALGGLALGPGLLAACGDDDDTSAGGDGGGGSNSLYVANWPLYIDEESVDLFAEQTGIDINYSEEYNDNNEYFARIQPVLANGDRIDPDIIVPTFWLASRLIELGWLEEIPFDQIPNAANLTTNLVNPAWDPEGKYTLPWQSGMAGIAYNLDVTGRELTSTYDLLDPEFRGKIGMLTEMRDTVGLFMLATGASIEDPSYEEAEEAFALIEEAVDSGQVRQFTGNDYQDDLVAGNYAATVGWSGDVAQLALENPALRFAIPEEGGTLWSDVMVIPKGARNIDNAAKWMDFTYDPENAARIAAWVQYISPVQGIEEVLTAMGGEEAALVDNPLVFPDDETLARLSSWGPLSDEEEAQFEARFSEIQGA